MRYCHLGRSGVRVSRLGLGTFNFGSVTEPREAFRIMDAALAAGINFFDTANHYPDFVHCGRTEEIIGRWFAAHAGRREQVVLATKVYQPMGNPDDPNDAPGLSKYKIRRHVEDSLRRLQTDHIDLYQMHHIDRRAVWEELWEAFDLLVQQGKVGYVGSSNFAGWDLVLAQAAARSRHCFGLATEQHKYNLLCRLPELEVLPAALHLGIGVLAYSPLASGVLGGTALRSGDQSRRGRQGRQQPPDSQSRRRLDQFAQLCRARREAQANVATAWILAQPGLSAAIIGPRTQEQLEQLLPAVDLHLDEATLARLEALFPAPAGPRRRPTRGDRRNAPFARGAPSPLLSLLVEVLRGYVEVAPLLRHRVGGDLQELR